MSAPSTLETVLRGCSAGAETAAPLLPEPARMVLRIVSAACGLAADLAAAGANPLVTIARIDSAELLLRHEQEDLARAIAAKAPPPVAP